MKKWTFVALFSLFCVTTAFAAETGVRPVTADAVIDAAVPAAPMTLAAALDKVARDYREMWIKDREGKRIRRACDFWCVQGCNAILDECQSNNGGTEYCQAQFDACMCANACCTGGPRDNCS